MLFLIHLFSFFLLAASVCAAELDPDFWEGLGDLGALGSLDDSLMPAPKRQKIAELNDQAYPNAITTGSSAIAQSPDQAYVQASTAESSAIIEQDPLNDSQIINQFLSSGDDADTAPMWFSPTPTLQETEYSSTQIEGDVINQNVGPQFYQCQSELSDSREQTQGSTDARVLSESYQDNHHSNPLKMHQVQYIEPTTKLSEAIGPYENLLKEVMSLNLPSPSKGNDEIYRNAVISLKNQSHSGRSYSYLANKLRSLSQGHPKDKKLASDQFEKLITIAGSLGAKESLESTNLTRDESKILNFIKNSKLPEPTNENTIIYSKRATELISSVFPRLSNASFVEKLNRMMKRNQSEINAFKHIIKRLADVLKPEKSKE